MVTTVFFSPHAESTDNARKRASGYADVDLSPRGVEDALALARHYSAIELDAVFCSDLRRATRTAALLFGERGLSIQADARLREFDYGQLTQCPVAQMENEIPNRLEVSFPGGENVVQAIQRVVVCLNEILHRHVGQRLVIIGHRATRYGIEYLHRGVSVAQLIHEPWEWREIPIWQYQFE
jgi:broad specificity phosphatase PhoE